MIIPAAAQAIGLTQLAIDSRPRISDVSMDGLIGPAEWYNGQQWTPPAKQPAPAVYSSFHGDPLLSLCVGSGGSIGTTDRNLQPGKWPTLDGAKAFYVEFQAQLSGQNLDYKPAFWLMPIEHAHMKDHYEDLDPGQPTFERYQEFDVHEGGFSGYAGFKSCCIAWSGVYPWYTREQTGWGWHAPLLDHTKNHTYAMTWDPVGWTASFYLDGARMYESFGQGLSPVIKRQHFFPIISANLGPRRLPYYIKVNQVRALVPAA